MLRVYCLKRKSYEKCMVLVNIDINIPNHKVFYNTVQCKIEHVVDSSLYFIQIINYSTDKIKH
jgi:hypothetical protein